MRFHLALRHRVSLPVIKVLRGAVGMPLLLATVALGSEPRSLPSLLAQPAPATGALHFPPLTTSEQSTITGLVALARQEELVEVPMRLRVTHASVADVVARLQGQLPWHGRIEMRHTSPARFTLNLPQATLRQILQAVADLSDCNFYILSDRLLLATDDQLTTAERAEYEDSAEAKHSSSPQQMARNQGMRILAAIIADKLNAVKDQAGTHGTAMNYGVSSLPLTTVSFGQLSPDLQQAVQQWVNFHSSANGVAPPRLTPDATITAGANQYSTHLEVASSVSATGHGNTYSYDYRH